MSLRAVPAAPLVAWEDPGMTPEPIPSKVPDLRGKPLGAATVSVAELLRRIGLDVPDRPGQEFSSSI